MFVGGAFVRSESGRYFQVKSAPEHEDADPETVNVPRGSRKDVRDAVLAAKNALARLGEAHRVQPRADPLSPRRGDGVAPRRARAVARARRPDATTRRRARSTRDRSRRLLRGLRRQVLRARSRRRTRSPGRTSTSASPSRWASSASSRPIVPRCSGSCRRSCRSSRGGNTCVALASERDPRTAIVWSECVATSDMPGGVINILTGHAKELVAAPREAPRGHRHRRVDRRRRAPQDASRAKAPTT